MVVTTQRSSTSTILFVLLALTVVNTVALVALLLRQRPAPRLHTTRPLGSGHGGGHDGGGGTCDAKTCGARDPVSDPDYNMREIAKQCILLEEHLTVEAKYCVDCVAKHLLHCHGLATEAVMLACDRLPRYPMMAESPDLFQRLMDEWLTNREDVDARLRMAAVVRDYRKRLVQAYYTGGGAAGAAVDDGA